MRHYTLSLTLLAIALALHSCTDRTTQSKSDILSQKVTGDPMPAIKELQDKGYIHGGDNMLMASFLMSHPDLKDFTYGQLIDSINAMKQNMAANMAVENNFGTDSMFIRTPNGEKYFLGLGELSFDKLVRKYSEQLPTKYTGDQDLVIDGSARSSEMIAKLCNDPDVAVIVRNVILIMRDNGQLNSLRLGDVAEISQRIRDSKEFAPFLELLK